MSLLRERARVEPDRVFLELVTPSGDLRPVTVGEIDREARRIGARLQGEGAQGSRAMILTESALEFAAAYFGCLYAGAIAVPVPMPRDVLSAWRLRTTMRNAAARFALTSAACTPAAAREIEVAGIARLPALERQSRAEEWSPPLIDPTSLAQLHYDPVPGGRAGAVMLTHRNLLHNTELVRRALEANARDRVSSYRGPDHPMGLIMELLLPLLSGATAVAPEVREAARTPLRWLREGAGRRVTVLAAPDSAYAGCVEELDAGIDPGVDLSSVRLALNGTEAVRPSTLETFSGAFARCGFASEAFYPFFGSSVATLLVCGGGRPTSPRVGSFDREELADGSARLVAGRAGRRVASCGQPRPGQVVRIVDTRSGRIVGPAQVGEIWVNGPSVSPGLWRAPAESAERFQAVLATGEGPFVRTGVRGFLLAGELFLVPEEAGIATGAPQFASRVIPLVTALR